MSKFYLTRRTLADLSEIEAFSMEKWGLAQTEIYMKNLYESFKYISENPNIGVLRQARSFPFLMAPAGRHFVIYKTIDNGVIIATILHGRRNIENIIHSMSYMLIKEIEDLEKKH
ncbi:toxin ParE1/3/4 [Kordia periserrulae]|uniref:Toxin ParE1/3/4 n=1 Tax=Kordia periserrulae TaxID=701523 RepID=A0A2T6BR83_9FLAO|nr:type II toxin-antitoxin system RelE/ParE family toxin [Kordia periserrulae]PTX58578.1 toxin ParE1/3/4 [Kordia periserrulae]